MGTAGLMGLISLSAGGNGAQERRFSFRMVVYSCVYDACALIVLVLSNVHVCIAVPMWTRHPE